MKITHRTITAATSTAKIPAPLDKYFRIISDAELEQLTGMNAQEALEETSVEGTPGYNIKHLAWVAPIAKYEDALSDQGFGTVELVDEEGDVYLAFQVHDRVYAVDEDEVADALS